MAKSIIQEHTDKLSRECLLCREEAERIGYYGELRHTGLHKHHIMLGTAGRPKAEHYGLWTYLCNERHHEYGPESPHAKTMQLSGEDKNNDVINRLDDIFEKLEDGLKDDQ